MEGAVIGGNVFLRDVRIEKDIELPYASIGGSLDCRGAQINAIDLTGSSIARELRLAVAERLPRWSNNSRLNLYNAHVDAIVDEPDEAVWPTQIGLDGF